MTHVREIRFVKSGGAVEQTTQDPLPSHGEEVHLLVAYQDTATRNRAIHVCDHLVAGLGAEFDFSFSWWRFSYLAEPRLAEAAAAAALSADMIVFSAHADCMIPPHVVSWIDSWVDRRPERAGALVAMIGLVDDPKKGLTPAHFYLRRVAERARMDYFPQAVLTLPERSHGSLEDVVRRSETQSAFLEDILRRAQPADHWGINE
jgi:hypothetical protein